MVNFGDYPGDFVLLSGDREIRSKIWSLPYYPRELTALTIFESPTGDGNCHFTSSSKPLEGPAAYNAKGVPSFRSDCKTLIIGPAPGIRSPTPRSVDSRSLPAHQLR